MRRRQIAPLALVLGLTIAGFVGARMLGQRDAHRDAEHRAAVAAVQIRERVEEGSVLAESLRRFMVAVNGVSAGEFESNASRWLSPAGFPAAAWVEQVPASRRAGYEQRVGPIVTRDRHLRIVPVESRSSYLPATLVSGISPMAVPGIDLGGESAVAATVTQARRLDAARATSLVTLRDGTKGLFLIRFAPRITGGVVTPGFVVVFVSELSLRAAAAGTTRLQLTVGGSSSGDLGGAAAIDTFTAAGKRFAVAVPGGSVHGGAAVLPWIILAAGLVLATLAGAYGVNAARRARAQDEVDRLFTLSSDLITVAGFDGYWKRVNPAFETRLGYSEREALSRPYLEFIHPDDRERSEAEALRLLGGAGILAFENRVICKDGSYRWIEWKATPVFEQATLYGVGRDVTERRQAEIDLRRLADEQSALRRVATLVARGGRPGELFSAVSDEIASLFGTEVAGVVRFEHERPAVVFVGVARSVWNVVPVGTRWELEDGLPTAEVYRTGRPARTDARGWSSATANAAATGTRLGIVSTVASPIIVNGVLWGATTVSAKRPLPPDADERLEKFTELVATAVSNIETRRELNASRVRVVAAADETRRRLERDLHDGIQQRLVSLALRARTAEETPRLPIDVRGELSLLSDGLRAAIDEVREFSRGIHPAILSESGLKPALQSLARRLPVPVKLDLDLGQRLPEALEVAAYYVVSEAFTNAVKHARASVIELTAHRRDGPLMLTVRDDGIGGADPSRGSGIIGLTDRVEALGGTISLVSPPGAGTMLHVQLPTDLAEAASTDTSPADGAEHTAGFAET